jgi:hypothetical protein
VPAYAKALVQVALLKLHGIEWLIYGGLHDARSCYLAGNRSHMRSRLMFPHDSVAALLRPRGGNLFPKLYSIASILIVFVSICLVWRYTVGSRAHMGWDPWAYSEWLINYAGGFVRRGLSGQIIAWFANGHSALTITTHFVFGIYCAFALLFLWLAFASARTNTAPILLSVIIPGGIASMARNNDLYFRKEILFLIVLEICCLLYLAIARVGLRSAQTGLLFVLLLLIFSSATILPFIHEAYLLYGAPSIFLLLFNLSREFPERHYLTRLLWLYPLFPICGFVIAALFKGDQSTAIAIWNSLSEIDRMIMNPSEPWKPYGQIMTLGYSTLNGIAHGAKVVLSGAFWFWAFIAGSVLALLTVFTGLLYVKDKDPIQATTSLSLVPLLFIAELPIFLGSDWGRDITNISLSYLVLAYGLKGRVLVPPIANNFVPDVRWVMNRPKWFFCFAVIFSITFSFPECCLDLGPRANPFSAFFPAIQRAYHAITPGATWVDQIKPN